MNNVFTEYELRLKAVAEANERNKSVVFDALAAAALTRITVEFDGEDDSGQIDRITAYAGELPAEFPSTSLTLQRVPQNAGDPTTYEATLRDAVESLCYSYLEQCYDRWENNGDAYGTFEFNVRNRSLHLDFTQRFVDFENSTHDF